MLSHCEGVEQLRPQMNKMTTQISTMMNCVRLFSWYSWSDIVLLLVGGLRCPTANARKPKIVPQVQRPKLHTSSA
jgi:hypothetical protein